LVPSAPIAGAVLTGGRCEPHATVGTGAGVPSALRTGQGRFRVEYLNVQRSVAAGAPGTSVDHAAVFAASAAVTLTSQDCGTSTSHGSFALPSSCITL